MDETKEAIAEKMKCFDLAGQLGQVLEVNPVWKDKYVIYKIGLDDCYIKLCFDLDDGRWLISGSHYAVLNLPKEAPDLMAGMSEAIDA